MRNHLLMFLAAAFVAACEGPEGPVGEAGPTGSNGGTGATGPTGEQGTDGIPGEDGDDAACAGRPALDITGLTGLSEDPYTTFLASAPITVQHNGTVPLHYSVLGQDSEYTWTGDQFSVRAMSEFPGTQVIVATDGCTTAIHEFELIAEPESARLGFLNMVIRNDYGLDVYLDSPWDRDASWFLGWNASGNSSDYLYAHLEYNVIVEDVDEATAEGVPTYEFELAALPALDGVFAPRVFAVLYENDGAIEMLRAEDPPETGITTGNFSIQLVNLRDSATGIKARLAYNAAEPEVLTPTALAFKGSTALTSHATPRAIELDLDNDGSYERSFSLNSVNGRAVKILFGENNTLTQPPYIAIIDAEQGCCNDGVKFQGPDSEV